MINLSSTQLNHKVHKLIQISSQENILLNSIEKFYEELNCFNDFISIINSETKNNGSKISIRLIDYFVTKYSKKNKVSYKLNDEQNYFYVYQICKLKSKNQKTKKIKFYRFGCRV